MTPVVLFWIRLGALPPFHSADEDLIMGIPVLAR